MWHYETEAGDWMPCSPWLAAVLCGEGVRVRLMDDGDKP